MTVHDAVRCPRHAGARRRPRGARPREHPRGHPRHPPGGARARPRELRPRRALHRLLRAVLHVRHDLGAERQPRRLRPVLPQGLRAHRRRRRRRARSRLPHLGEGPVGRRAPRGHRRRRHRLHQDRGPEEEAGVRRDGHPHLSRLPRSAGRRALGAAHAGGDPAAGPDLLPRLHRRHVRRPRGTRLHHPQPARQSRRRAWAVWSAWKGTS